MIHARIAYTGYSPHRFTVSRAEWSLIWDEKNRPLIDFTSGWNVTNLGWNHPEIAEAMVEQIARNTYAPLWGSDPVQEEYAERLVASLPEQLDTCVKATGGTESVEEAIKIARAATGRKKIVGFRSSYHGQLFAAMTLGFPPELLAPIAPGVPEFVQLDFPREDGSGSELNQFSKSLETVLSNMEVAAFITEPGIVTGWGSVWTAPAGYLSLVRNLTERYGTLLVVDEVGTGFSRTGHLFGIGAEGVVPDLVCLAKGISNGAAALGAVAGKHAIIAECAESANLTSTFWWTPVACAAAIKTLEIHRRDDTARQATEKGEFLLQELTHRLGDHVSVVDIRGRGMELWIEVDSSKTYRTVLELAWKFGLHATGDNESLLQVMPPLTIELQDLKEGVNRLVRAFDAVREE